MNLGSMAGLAEARAILAESERIVVLTGAGVSADSGVPTFRGPDGLWRGHDPSRLATPAAFARDPRLVWEWYGWRRDRIAACRPNAAHHALAALALDRGATLVTQNVDGLHRLAAAEQASARSADPGRALPLELHGSIFRSRCTRCGDCREDRASVDASSAATLPSCGACGTLTRPDVVWFGEPLDVATLNAAHAAAAAADACLVVGTSAVVYPAAGIPAATLATGGRVIEVNPEPTPLSVHAAACVRGRAAELVPALTTGI